MQRRQFLGLAGSAAGYALCVRVPSVSHASEPEGVPPLAKRFEQIAPAKQDGGRPAGEPHMTPVELDCDVLVAGGGMAGVCAALSAARHGAGTVLCQDRSRLGGNASSEVKMHIVGADNHGARPGWREGGIIEELRLEDGVRNPQRSWELWDLLLYEKCMAEPNLTLLLDSVLFGAEVKDGLIQRVLIRCDKTEHLYRVAAKVYLDCTGDSRLGLESGSEMRWGREGREEFGETLAMPAPDRETLGSSILFTARDHGRPLRFVAPPWARKVTKEMLKFRPVTSWEYGYWWVEWGGQLDTIRDNERIRFELLSIVLGVWDYIKNSGAHPSSANWAMDWIGMVPGKRESRRLVGDVVVTQNDLEGRTGGFHDAVAVGGWSLDDHPPSGFDRSDERPATQVRLPDVYNLPFRALYSRNIGNLMMAGRNVSVTHAALSSTRVMATCSVLGQAAGTAAARCAALGLRPRELAEHPERIAELQQLLLRDDQTIKGVLNRDPNDLARSARVTATSTVPGSAPANVINGWVRDLPGKLDNRWVGELGAQGATLELSWDSPPTLSRVQLTFDTGFERELTLSASDGVTAKMVRGPQPETVRDYELIGTLDTGEIKVLASVAGNYQRLRRHQFDPVKLRALALRVLATNGSPTARVYEVRCA